ncbi:MAG: PmoA family protein, partial [Lentisphaeria bacterium]|nr:PmoA family protein [Lentisphaeria bacterium]
RCTTLPFRLAARRDPEAVPALAELLGDTRNADLAAAAARALGDIGGGAATEAVLAWATDTPAPHRSVAADALLRCETALRAAADRARLERLYGVLAQEGWPRSAREAALAGQLALLPPEQRSLALAQALRAADPLHFAAAVRYLREHGGAEDLTAAAAGLWALDDAWRREMLAVLLAERRHRPAQAGLLRCLDLVGDADIAPFCAALAVLGDATAVAGLCAAGVRTQAPQVLEALALLSGPGVEDALRKRLGSADPAVVVLVLRALISRRCGAAAPDLLPLLRHPSADVRIAALKALGELGGEAEVPTLLDDMRQARLRQETEEAARALAAIGMRAAERETFAARILEAARGAEPDIAAGLLGAAGALHAECVLPALEEALRAPAAELRRGACKSLSQWPTAAPLPALLAAAREASDPGERVLVLRGLAAVAGRPSPPAGVDPVAALGEALARSERGDTTGALLAALTMHPGLPALRLACDSLDRRPEAKEEALHAALTIAETALGSLSGEARAEARVLVARLEASAAASPELAARAKAVGLALHRPPNLARRGTASSPDGIEKDGAAGGDQAGIDGNPETYWDEENGKPEYRYRVTFPEPVDASAIRIVAWKHHEYAPKDFAIVCDDRVVHTVRGASYRDNEFWVPFPRTRLTWLELRITAYYAHSPAIRELGIYDGEAAPPATAAGKSAAAPDEPPEPRFSWQELPTSLALHNRDRVVWRFNAGAEDSKPCFHPLGLLDGTPLSAFRPDDHPWHRGLWFSWKLLNGVNYWEEDPRTGKSKGESRIVRCRAQAGSPFPARLDLELEYAPEGSAPILGEQRAIVVSVPDSRGCYRLHWDGLFTALAEPVRLDRTPIPGEPGGVAHGGYAGLSYRASLAPATWTVTDSEGRTGMELHRRQARWADFLCTGGEAGATGGVAILDHPANPRHPTPWFVVLNPAGRFGFLNPAPLCLEPLTLAPGEAMRLRYCVLVHPGALTREEIEAVWQDFAK